MTRALRTGAALAALLLSGCDYLPGWLGDSNDKVPLPGKRVAVLSDAAHLKADDTLAGIDVTVPDARVNDTWRQAGGGPQGMTGNLHLTGLSHHDSTRIGDGNGWDAPLYGSPIAAGGVIYAMDAKGYITAHDAGNIDKVKWTNKSLVADGEPDLMGGGLAFDNDRIYATSGRGRVAALEAASGKELWKQSEGVPLRAAPKVAGGKLYALSVDNQTFALDADHGTLLWSHRGINENAEFLASTAPAVTDAIAVSPYSSGEIHALDTQSGQDIWSDTLLLARRTYATAGFSGIGGNPIIRDDIVYAPGSSGFIAALALLNGRRLWEQDISSLNTPWIAGDFLYMLSLDNELVCLERSDGRIKWIKQLPRFEDEEKRKRPLVWRGPLMAEGQLLVAGLHGQIMAFSPKDGATLTTTEIPDGITDMPIVMGGKMYFITQNAKLHVLY